MEDLLKDLASQVPALLVLVYLVTLFLKHLKEYNNTMTEFRLTLREMHTDGLNVIKENTKILSEVMEKLDNL